MISRLVAALWLGSAFFLITVGAPAAFRAAPNPTAAADVVGAMLTRWHYFALLAPIVLLALAWRRAKTALIALLLAAIVLAAAQALVDVRIRQVRAQSPVAISHLARTDPVRRHFGMLHGLSSILLLLQAVAAAGVVAADTSRDRTATPELPLS
jgi:hypothetical protein